MDIAGWILVAILSVTLFVFLMVGIFLMLRILSMSDDVHKVIMKSQDIADNANGVVTNMRGMTAIGGTMEMLVDKYVNPKLKEKINEAKERSENDRKSK